MLGIDLYKEVLLNGEKYKGKMYKGGNNKTYYVGARGDSYSIFETDKMASVINMYAHEEGCIGINEFMLTELEEVKPEIEMPWQECLLKYIENPEKYYMKAITPLGTVNEFTSTTSLGYNYGSQLTLNQIKNSRWFLCER